MWSGLSREGVPPPTNTESSAPAGASMATSAAHGSHVSLGLVVLPGHDGEIAVRTESGTERNVDVGAGLRPGGIGHARMVRPDRRFGRIRHWSASSTRSAAMKASWGTSTDPTIFMRFLPAFCFSSNFRLREMSPP